MAIKEDWEKQESEMKRLLKLAGLEIEWLSQHYFDQRNGFTENKIKFDNESRSAIMYYEGVITILKDMRTDAGIPLEMI